MRRHLAQQGFGADRGFRWRGGEISRLEGLSDAVFAFAVTLLAVSLEVPETFNELLRVLRGFFAFAVCFSILFWVWYDHYRFFRRYGLADGVTTTLTGALLFIVLFYVYPMKFLFAMLFDQLFGRPHPISSGSLRMRSATTAEGTTATPMSPEASWTGASSSWTERPNWITTV